MLFDFDSLMKSLIVDVPSYLGSGRSLVVYCCTFWHRNWKALLLEWTKKRSVGGNYVVPDVPQSILKMYVVLMVGMVVMILVLLRVLQINYAHVRMMANNQTPSWSCELWSSFIAAVHGNQFYEWGRCRASLGVGNQIRLSSLERTWFR